MAVKAVGQQTVLDLTDGHSVELSNDNFTFQGTTNAVNGTQTTTCMVQAMCGADQVPCAIGKIENMPTGLSIVSDEKSPVPTLTITATSALTAGGTVNIPVQIGELTIYKTFSWGIAFKGATGATGQSTSWYTGTAITGTATAGTVFSGSGIASAKVGDMYLNTSTGNVYKCTTAGAAAAAKWAYAGNIKGQTGNTGQSTNWYTGTGITGTSDTATVFLNSGVSSAKVNDMYLNTSTQNVYKCTVAGAASAAKWVYVSNIKGMPGDTGAPGQDALQLVVISSNGTIFKNTAVATVLTAHVYKGAAEVTGDALAKLGTIRWYKDGGTTAVATGQSLTISAGDVDSKATYTAQLEG